MPLPLAVGAGLAAGIAVAKTIQKSLYSHFFIQNKRGLCYNGIDEKRFLFIKWNAPQWVASQDVAEGFPDVDEANDCIKENKLRGVMVVSKK